MISRIINRAILIMFILGSIATASLIGQTNKFSKTDGISQINTTRLNRIILYKGIQYWWQNSPFYTIAYLDSMRFLNTTGFLLSGINSDGEHWTNGVLPNYISEDYLIGKEGDSIGYPSTYTINKDSPDFGSEWRQWSLAVRQGAEFYDGNGDGIYEPHDKNQNNQWDPDEDRPPLYGDMMIWSSYYDGVKPNRRKTKNVQSQGIQISETIWAYNSDINLETTFFVKYKIENTGSKYANHDSVYFSLYVDGDLGYFRNDLLATDPKTNSVFFYESGEDFFSLDEKMSLKISMVQSAPRYTGDANDIYTSLKGENLIENRIAGYKNLDLNSIWKLPDRSTISDLNLLRELMIYGNNIDVCIDDASVFYNIDCNDVDRRFLYAGDPLLQRGWLNDRQQDQEIFLTSGNFNLEVKKPVELIYSFVVGTGETGNAALINAHEVKRKVDEKLFQVPNYFSEVNPTIITTENSIELVWETWQYFYDSISGYNYDIDFEGFNVYMFNSPSTHEEINGRANKIKIASYDVWNDIDYIYSFDNSEFDTDLVYKKGRQLDSRIYRSGETGRIILKLTRDPFLNKSLIKGRPYYIAISPFGVNKNALLPTADSRSHLISPSYNYGIFEAPPIIIQDEKGNPGIVLGENFNDPYFKGIPLEHVSGNSEVEITYSVYDKQALTEDTYEIGFIRANTMLYELEYYIKNLSKNEYLAENISFRTDDSKIQNLRDGFLINIDWLSPGIINVEFEGDNQWFKDFNNLETGVFYVGSDLDHREKITPILPLKLSTVISADKLADVELVFGEESRAYRYLRRAVRYLWAGVENPDEGFVSIPVSAYRKNIDGSKTQLSLGFLENAFINDTLKYPDAKWNPATDIKQSKEYLIVFSSEYSDQYSTHEAYIGNVTDLANITHGYKLESTNDSLNMIARSPWFDALYVIGFEMDQYIYDFSPSGKLTIDANHILSPDDKYTFTIKKESNLQEKKEQFEKVNVFPNPLFAYNPATSYFGQNPDDPFVTFSNLPEQVEIKIYTLSGTLVRTLKKDAVSSMLRWNLLNESERRVGSGMYLAIVESPGIGQKVLKFAIIMPQKQVHF